MYKNREKEGWAKVARGSGMCARNEMNGGLPSSRCCEEGRGGFIILGSPMGRHQAIIYFSSFNSCVIYSFFFKRRWEAEGGRRCERRAKRDGWDERGTERGPTQEYKCMEDAILQALS